MSASNDSGQRSFATQKPSAEELLKDQTVGLVQLDDYRKRRREVEDQQGDQSGTVTPRTDGSDNDTNLMFKRKKKKVVGRKLLSFDTVENQDDVLAGHSKVGTQKSQTSINKDIDNEPQIAVKRSFKPNPHLGSAPPKAMTKATLVSAATERERWRAEFLKVQEHVMNSEIAIPFVFYDGSIMPGGTVKVKKGEHIWLLLDRCRKLGAELGIGSEGSIQGGGNKKAEGKKSWARIGVDDLMLLRGDTIIPHHLDIYYFIANHVADLSRPDRLLFDYAGTAKLRSENDEQSLIRTPRMEKLEGHDDDPAYTKVVDRRWYEKNKHIYPATLWREYKVGKEADDLPKGRRDAQGNVFFFS
ncbi:hypothetical protein LTR64_002993 [Lithohypha guttulata]|uniref:uncharacterized protein n=1 Tax=Lithohypha guttulata TaxID=1690604 RepID=UPI002DDFB745|nr:hypothetical protein LTR51_000783 [Lithohypha guttulata]